VKILLLCRSLSYGGTERQISVLAQSLSQKGHEVSIAVFYANGELEHDLHLLGIPIIDLKKSGRWDLLSFFVRLLKAVQRFRPQVIYGFLGTSNILTIFLKPLFPMVLMVWGVRSSNVDLKRYDWLHLFSYHVECWLSNFADKIICNSRAGMEYAAANGFPRQKMSVIPNGIDVERFKADAKERLRVRREWGVSHDEKLIGLVARLDLMKDHQTFLKAAAMLSSEEPNVRFVCVGDGPDDYKKGAYQLAQNLGLDGKLLWVGARNDMVAVYSALDIATSTSLGEGFSNVIAEAMACGVPCVVTDVGDSAFIVGTTGIVVPPSNPDLLCAGLLRMLKQLGGNIQDEVRTLIVSRFTNEILANDTIKLFSR
jgi:glycosyltransferase involved in cell wall biosynthesis